MQTSGIVREDAIRIIHHTSTRSSIPEALRVAHLIASGITTHEPKSILEREKV